MSDESIVDDLNEMFGISQMLREGRKERNRLEKLIYDCQVAADCVVHQTHDLPKFITQLRDENAVLRKQAAQCVPYMQHKDGCGWVRGDAGYEPVDDCTCGLDAVLNAMRKL